MSDPAGLPPAPRLSFGPFELVAAERALFEQGRAVRLGARALDLLISLVEHAGELVGKQELIAAAWPDSTVDEANLRVHVAALRKVLGDGQAGARYIVNVSGRGYRFVAPVSRHGDMPAAKRFAPAEAPPATPAHNLPAPLVRMVGRADVVAALANQVRRQRFVTIVGPGGIGKSTVAVAVAERLVAADGIGTCFVDLSAVTDQELLPAALATAAELSLLSDDPLPGLISFLRERRMLIVFDNCEHVIEAAAKLAEDLLKGASELQVLATSREPLRAEGERVHRLRSLDCPPPAEARTAAAALAYPAVQLFVERVKANLDTFELADDDAPLVADICRQLDGIPLAIELAAARVELLGLRGLAAGLGDRFLVVAKGRRTALPRHQTLRATLDWSYQLLPEAERVILRRLGVFRSGFMLDHAVAVVADATLDAADVIDGVVNLAGKSLVTTDVSGPVVQHRLLHLTRVYAFGKLLESGEAPGVLRRHAEHYCRLLGEVEAAWETMPRPQWLARFGPLIDDIRAALVWAFSPEGDAAIGVRLTALAMPLGFQLSLIEEFRGHAERALRVAAELAPPQRFAEMRLSAAYGRLSLNVLGPTPGGTAEFDRAIALADQLGTPKYRVEPMGCLAIFALGHGDNAAALAAARVLAEFVHTLDDPGAVRVADRILAHVQHFAGDHASARTLATRVMTEATMREPIAYAQASIDVQMSMRVILARILWMEGFADQAVRVADDSIAFAESDGAFSLCQALALAACPIALWRGDDAAARLLAARLREQAQRYTLGYWQAWSECYEMALAWRHAGARPAALPQARALADMLATVAADLLHPETVARAEQGEPGWHVAEVLRARAELLLREGATAAAEELLRRALDVSRTQGARAWELRAAASLARLWAAAGRGAEARALLAPLVAGFTEGAATADLAAARQILAATV